MKVGDKVTVVFQGDVIKGRITEISWDNQVRIDHHWMWFSQKEISRERQSLMTSEEKSKVRAIQIRLKGDPAIYRDPVDQNRWWMTDFTVQQHIRNLEEVRELLDELLSEESPGSTEQGSG